MSKDLNKEYLEMVQSDVPDLWDRISASLPEKQPAAQTETKKKTKIYRFGILAAACVCVAIIIPVVVMNGRLKAKTASLQEQYTAAAMVEEAKTEGLTESASEAAEAEEEMFSADTAAGEAKTYAVMNDTNSDAYAIPEAAEEAEPAAAAGESEPAEEMAEAPLAAALEETEEAAFDMDQASPEEVYLENVPIRITGPAEDDGLEGCYLADVLESNGYFAEGDIIFVRADEDSPEAFADGIAPGICTCNLQETETESGDTVYLLR